MSKRHSSLESVSSSSSGGFLKKDREEMARREAATAEAAEWAQLIDDDLTMGRARLR